METKIEQLRSKADCLLTSLVAHPKKEGVWQVTVNFSGYSSLFATVNDLMKLCTVALLTEQPYVSSLVGNPTIDLANIMELAVQLMPKNEAEFLDEVRGLLSEKLDQFEVQMPKGNYSTMVVHKQEAS